ncbi:MAG: prepilin-type N-terminal cleavage/methylation domain-containing protein [Planctomycetota bacterium]|nr:prepilin-type N-terminal cleavage/methylation domain-containing protein [Planctomycetota bacterium]
MSMPCLHTQLRTPQRKPARGSGGFSLIEVLFAISILAVGIVGILSLFTTGISAAAWSGNMTTAAMEAQSLYTRVVSEVDANNERVFLRRIADPKSPSANPPDNEWIHQDNNILDPILVDPDREWWWQCRVTKYQMDLDAPLESAKDISPQNNPSAKQFPIGLYQIAIAVYRNWKPNKPPVVTYTTFVTAGY